MFPKKELENLINTQGDSIVSFADESQIVGIFTKPSDLVPALIPYVSKENEYVGFYTKASDIPMGIFTYADKHWIAVACKTVEVDGEAVFNETLLRYRPIVTPQTPPTTYPVTMTFGNFSVEIDIEKVSVKQGSLIVNIAAIDKFVTDKSVGSEPMEVTVIGKVSRGLSDDLIDYIKNPASKTAQHLTISGTIAIDAVVKEYEVTQEKTEEKEDFKIVFSEVRSI